MPSSPSSVATTGKLSHHHHHHHQQSQQDQPQQHHRYHHRAGGSQSNGVTSEEEEEEEEEEEDYDAMGGPRGGGYGNSYLRDFNRHHGGGNGSSGGGRMTRDGSYDMNNYIDDNASIASANSALTTLSAPAALSHTHPSSSMRHPIGTTTAAATASRTSSVVVNRWSQPPPTTQSQPSSQPTSMSTTMTMANGATTAGTMATRQGVAARGGGNASMPVTRASGAWEATSTPATALTQTQTLTQTPRKSSSSSSSHHGKDAADPGTGMQSTAHTTTHTTAPATPSRGLGLGLVVGGVPGQGTSSNPNTPSKWKQQSDMFRQAMKSSRDVTKALESGAPLPPSVPSAPDPSLVPCPHCGRRFNGKAADRHIPQCQNIKAKPKVPTRHIHIL